MKVNPFDRKVRSQFCTAALAFATLYALLVSFIPLEFRSDGTLRMVVVVGIILIYILIYIRSNLLKACTLRINGIDIKIEEGDLFKSYGLVVIPFNEYFDTIVSNHLISTNSLNGQYLSKKTPDEISTLDNSISRDCYLRSCAKYSSEDRSEGKSVRYELGSIFRDGNYLLTAMTPFDKNNNARMTIKNYIAFLIKFWQEVSRTNDGQEVFIPLLGGGITRFEQAGQISQNDKLIIMLMTLRYSKPTMPSCMKLHIILRQEEINRIDLFHIGDIFPN